MESQNIKVKILAMPQKDMKFSLSDKTTISVLKNLIAEKGKFDVPIFSWKLVYAGRRLNDNETLKDLQIESNQSTKNQEENKIVLHISWTNFFNRGKGNYSEEQITMRYYKDCASDIMYIRV